MNKPALGVYMQHPEEMLRYAVSMGMAVSCALIDSRDTLVKVSDDKRLQARAAGMIVNYMLKELVAKRPSREAFHKLCDDIKALLLES